MGVLAIIVGIILAIGGVACMFTPIVTFLAAGYIICIALFVFGVFGLIYAITRKSGAATYIVAILAIIVGIVCLANPGGSLVISDIILILVAVFLLVSGIFACATAVSVRKENKKWWLGLIAGIIGIVVGIICIVSPFAEVLALGILIGLLILAAGIELIAIGAGYSDREGRNGAA